MYSVRACASIRAKETDSPFPKKVFFMSEQSVSSAPSAAKPPVPSISDAAEGVSGIFLAVNGATRALGPLSQSFDRSWFEANLMRQLADHLNIADLLAQQIYAALRQRGVYAGITVPDITEAADSPEQEG